MPIFTDLTEVKILTATRKLYGTVLTRPTLTYGATSNDLTYACDVNISEKDPTGLISQYVNEKNGKPTEDPPDVGGLPGQPPPYWYLGDELKLGTVMRNVNIARGNQELIYADVGTPVTLEKTGSGKWEITGFSIEQPGTYMLYPVDIPELSFGPIEFPAPPQQPPRVGPRINGTVETHHLTFGEMGEYQPFGNLPFGATAIFIGGKLVSIV